MVKEKGNKKEEMPIFMSRDDTLELITKKNGMVSLFSKKLSIYWTTCDLVEHHFDVKTENCDGFFIITKEGYQADQAKIAEYNKFLSMTLWEKLKWLFRRTQRSNIYGE